MISAISQQLGPCQRSVADSLADAATPLVAVACLASRGVGSLRSRVPRPRLWRRRAAGVVAALALASGALALCSPVPAGANEPFIDSPASPFIEQASWHICRDERSAVFLVYEAGSLDAAPWPSGFGVTLLRGFAGSVGEMLAKVGVLGLFTGSDESPTRAVKAFHIAGDSGLFRACSRHGGAGLLYTDWLSAESSRILASSSSNSRVDLIRWTRYGPLLRLWIPPYGPGS